MQACSSSDHFVSDESQKCSAVLSLTVVNSDCSHQGKKRENISDPFLEFCPLVQQFLPLEMAGRYLKPLVAPS